MDRSCPAHSRYGAARPQETLGLNCRDYFFSSPHQVDFSDFSIAKALNPVKPSRGIKKNTLKIPPTYCVFQLILGSCSDQLGSFLSSSVHVCVAPHNPPCRTRRSLHHNIHTKRRDYSGGVNRLHPLLCPHLQDHPKPSDCTELNVITCTNAKRRQNDASKPTSELVYEAYPPSSLVGERFNPHGVCVEDALQLSFCRSDRTAHCTSGGSSPPRSTRRDTS